MDSSQKTNLAQSLNRVAQAQARSAIDQLGKALPCSVVAVAGSIVTVKFELQSVFTLPHITCPMFGPEYIRYPTQVGDKGVVLPIDAYLGGISDLGGGDASLTVPGNLSSLIFFPIASRNWSSSENPNAVVIYGPDGCVIRNTTNQASLTVDADGNCIVRGLKSYSWDVNGYGSRVTYTGGNNFQQDNYTIGANVTSTNHAWSPPSLPPV